MENDFQKDLKDYLEPHISVNLSTGSFYMALFPSVKFIDRYLDSTFRLNLMYYFKNDMSGLYLILKIPYNNATKKKYGNEDYLNLLQNESDEIREFLKKNNKLKDDFVYNIDLALNRLRARAHDRATIVAKYYEKGKIPSTEELVSDINYFLDLRRFVIENYTNQSEISLNDNKDYFTENEVEDIMDDERLCDSFYDYLLNMGYYFDKETIENYLLSLKVKPFVILTGNSGTGKTKLSQVFAQYLSLEDIEYQEEEIKVPKALDTNNEIKDYGAYDGPKDNDFANLDGGNYVEYSKEVKQSFVKEGKFQISSLYPFDEYYGTCSAELNGVKLVVNIRSENIIIFKNSPEIMNYLSNKYKGDTFDVNFKINSSDVSKVIIDNYTPKNHILKGPVSKTVFNRIKLPLRRKKDNFPGTTSDFYPIKYEVPCRVIVDNKVEGECTLRSYAWIELDNKDSYQIQSLKNQDSFYLRIFLDTFEYNQKQTTEFSSVGDYIDYKSFKKNLGLDLSEKRLDEELKNKIKKIFNFDEDLEDDSLEKIKNTLNLTGYETEEELIEILSEAMNKKQDNLSDDLYDENNLENNSNSDSKINDNKNSEIVKLKKIINYKYSSSNYKIIPVGANWTENRHIVGYYNVITNKYQSTPAYDLIKQAHNFTNPHFLILDEMNLSHVERYFADFLSAIESGEPIPLYGQNNLEIPSNLFIIGTVNVDETTYMFSPKVLDRANVLEFKPLSAEDYMLGSVDTKAPSGDVEYLENPLSDMGISDLSINDLQNIFKDVMVGDVKFWDILSDEIFNFQEILKKSGFDFGFRVINEIVRFMLVSWKYEGKPSNWTNWERYFDAQIKQKMLPKLHGSEKIIGETLDELYRECLRDSNGEIKENIRYPSSFKKIDEMRKILNKQRYMSFIN